MGEGGAIFGDPAFVSVDSSQFRNNVAVGTTPYGTNAGGAIVTNRPGLHEYRHNRA